MADYMSKKKAGKKETKEPKDIFDISGDDKKDKKLAKKKEEEKIKKRREEEKKKMRKERKIVEETSDEEDMSSDDDLDLTKLKKKKEAEKRKKEKEDPKKGKGGKRTVATDSDDDDMASGSDEEAYKSAKSETSDDSEDGSESSEEDVKTKSKKFEKRETTPSSKKISFKVDSKSLFENLIRNIGPVNREVYVENARKWLSKVLEGKSKEDQADFMKLLLKLCNKIPLDYEMAKARFAINKEKFDKFAEKASIDLTESKPQQVYRREVEAFLKVLKRYPTGKDFSWDSIISQPEIQEATKKIVEQLKILNTIYYQFFYWKSIPKASSFRDMAIINVSHSIILNTFVMMLIDPLIDKSYKIKVVFLEDGNVLPIGDLSRYATTVTQTADKNLKETTKMLRKDAADLKNLIEAEEASVDDKMAEKLLGRIKKHTLSVAKFLLPPNPHMLMMTRDYRIARAKNDPSSDKFRSITVGLMMETIKTAYSLMREAYPAEKINVDEFNDPIQKRSVQRSLDNILESSPRATLKKYLANINAAGGFTLNIEGDFFQGYFIALRVLRNLVRSYKRYVYGTGSEPDTRRVDKAKKNGLEKKFEEEEMISSADILGLDALYDTLEKDK